VWHSDSLLKWLCGSEAYVWLFTVQLDSEGATADTRGCWAPAQSADALPICHFQDDLGQATEASGQLATGGVAATPFNRPLVLLLLACCCYALLVHCKYSRGVWHFAMLLNTATFSGDWQCMQTSRQSLVVCFGSLGP
jgi:hypothetical protein